MAINEYNYFPSIKTTDAELKGFSKLDSIVLKGIMPVFELTRGRPGKLDKVGRIKKRIDSIKEFCGNNPFILDLTGHEELMNAEIELLLEPDNGYENWRNFLKTIECPNLVPALHYVLDDEEDDIKNQASELEKQFGELVYRINPAQETSSILYVVNLILSAIKSPKNLHIILDLAYIEKSRFDKYFNDAIKTIEALNSLGCGSIITLSSSFPKSVLEISGCGESEGKISMLEVMLTQELQNRFQQANIKHGDYASIHPVRYPTAGGNWVPRIDVPLDDQYFYHRYRRDAGGYVLAAKKVLENDLYTPSPHPNTWGDLEIKYAAEGKPNGISPSHWIAVRLNLHITRQYHRTLLNSISDLI
ncbi:MAG: hypothetical protein K0R98_578 [Rickettsiaceae bacterium]|jgi:hypothetical protein|nr:hypothetical protein [Rickettsiaceae bacterium]